MTQRAAGVDHRRTDTRDRIQTVALKLFATRGYANTSLREIADELGVTKAALYFHFKTKDDILNGIMLGHLESISAMIEEAEPGLVTMAGREQLLRRFSDYQAARSQNLVKLIRENFTEISNLPFGAEIKAAHRRLLDALAGPDATLIDRVRARTAFVAIQSAAMSIEHDKDKEDKDDEAAVREAALTVALEVLRGVQPASTA